MLPMKTSQDVGTVACLGTIVGSGLLLCFALWLQVSALQSEVRTLQGRVESLERSHDLSADPSVLSGAVLSDGHIKYHRRKESKVDSYGDMTTTTARTEDTKTYAAVQTLDAYNYREKDHGNNERLRREVYEESDSSIQNLAKRVNSLETHNFHDFQGLRSNNDSLIPTLSHTLSKENFAGSTSLRTLKKTKEARKRKKPHARNGTSFSSMTMKYSTTTEATLISRPSRVMQTETGLLGSLILPPTIRNKPIYEESRASPVTVVRPFSRTRRRRPKHEARNASIETLDESGPVRPARARPLIAAHYHGETSRYTASHEHYDGNGRLRHPDGIFRDWAPVDWMSTLGMNSHLSLSEHGVVTVRNSGLYFLYVQIYYVDEHDTNGFRLYVNRNPILHCTTHSSNEDHSAKSNTCFTASLAYLNTNDQISVSDVEGLRYSLFEPAKSFFGFFKVSDDKLR